MNQAAPATIRQRLRRGIGGQAFSQAVAFGVQMAAVPLFLAFWGLELYGEWVVLFSIPAYLSLADAGLTSATIHDMTMRASRGDTDGARSSFQTSWLIVTIGSLAASAALIGLAAWLPVEHWLGFERIGASAVVMVLALLLAQVVVGQQAILLAGALIAIGDYGLAAALLALMRLLGFGAMAAALAGGAGVVGTAAALAAGCAAGAAAILATVAARNHWARHGVAAVRRDTVRHLWRPALASSGMVASSLLAIQSPLQVIAAIAGPEQAGVFYTLRLLVRAAVTAAAGLLRVLEPEMAIAFGRGDHDLLRRLHRRSVQLAVWLSLGALAGFVALGDVVLAAFTGGVIDLRYPLFGLLLAAAAAQIVRESSAAVVIATNRHAGFVAACLGANLAAIMLGGGLASAVAPAAAPDAVAAALLAGETATLAYALAVVLRHLDDRLFAVLASAAAPPIGIVRRLPGGSR